VAGEKKKGRKREGKKKEGKRKGDGGHKAFRFFLDLSSATFLHMGKGKEEKRGGSPQVVAPLSRCGPHFSKEE